MTEKQETRREIEVIPAEWLKSIPLPMFVLDERGRIIWCNDTFVEMTGYDRDGLVGARLDALFGQRNISRILDDLLKLYKGQRFSEREYDLLRQSGSKMHVEMDLTPIFGEGEKRQIIDTVIGVIRHFEPVE